MPEIDSGIFLCTIVRRMSGTDEEFVPEDEMEEGPAALKKLRERLKKAVEEKQEYLEGWQRSRADFANYKREEARAQKEKEARLLVVFVEDLLPALDAFEMASKHAPDNKEIQLVQKQLSSCLKKTGVEQFGAAGEPFDPNKHEALRQVETDNPEADHTIDSVQRSGYK